MLKKIRIGFHVSIEGGIANSVTNAVQLGCNAFQIFTRSPRRWGAKPLDPDDLALFRSRLRASSITKESVAVHMPYLPNLATSNEESYSASIEVLCEELTRCEALGLPFLIIHLGNRGGDSQSLGVDRLSNAICIAQERTKQANKGQGPIILLENSSGMKNSIGSEFEELRIILDKIENKNVGICLDTCHAFASGYDLTTEKDVDRTMNAFDCAVGVRHLKWIHLNDSKDSLASHRDRHEHIGKGKIGLLGMKAILARYVAKDVPIVMETPKKTPDDDSNNMATVHALLP